MATVLSSSDTASFITVTIKFSVDPFVPGVRTDGPSFSVVFCSLLLCCLGRSALAVSVSAADVVERAAVAAALELPLRMRWRVW